MSKPQKDSGQEKLADRKDPISPKRVLTGKELRAREAVQQGGTYCPNCQDFVLVRGKTWANPPGCAHCHYKFNCPACGCSMRDAYGELAKRILEGAIPREAWKVSCRECPQVIDVFPEGRFHDRGSVAPNASQSPPLGGNNSVVDPESDPSLIRLGDAAEKYNIPKSTLTKNAKRPPGHPGYVWSRTVGRKRYFRRADLEYLNRARPHRSKLRRLDMRRVNLRQEDGPD
ncbi:MAG: hypothetical protein HYZ53_20900 [Planctomycetes bacterium]|nr:hypothetical protein [Planctomycetota bacterium]